MDFNNFQFPIAKKISTKTIGDDIIGVRPGESPEQSYQRHLMEQRKKKLEKIRTRMNVQIRKNNR